MKKKDKKLKKTHHSPAFPANVLRPVSNFLSAKLHTLEKRKKEISKEDPFSDKNRVDDNAASDTEADEQFGHARSVAINKELNKNVINIKKALTRIKLGKYGICEDCHELIDTDRLIAFPEANFCAKCAAKREK